MSQVHAKSNLNTAMGMWLNPMGLLDGINKVQGTVLKAHIDANVVLLEGYAEAFREMRKVVVDDDDGDDGGENKGPQKVDVK